MLACRFRRVLFALTLVTTAVADTFTVAVYNVENLFDVDGVSLYDEYQPERYGPRHLATKLRNVAEVVARIEDGRGPDILLLQEIEIDHTPVSSVSHGPSFWQRFGDRTAVELLAQDPLPAVLADVPAEAWLLKALADRGVTGYTVVAGTDRDAGRVEERRKAIKCVTLTRFPVLSVRQHETRDARNILEVEMRVGEARLHVFNTHWKSGAGDPALEEIRVQNARVLRGRIEALLAEDPQADIIVGGDFNSHYNQKVRYPEMRVTGINDILRSQGNELALRGSQRDLYNLWFELPVEERGSDTYRGEWGTLIQLLVTRGLYDHRGIQYVDNSFTAVRIAGLNVDAAGAPLRWDAGGGSGSGFSDHLPVLARFKVVSDNRADRWLSLQRPSKGETRAQPIRVSYAAVDAHSTAIDPATLPAGANLRDGTWSGKLFRIEAPVVPDRHPRVRVRGEEYEVYGVDDAIRDQLHAQRRSGEMRFLGELGTFKGRWQFVVKDVKWVLP